MGVAGFVWCGFQPDVTTANEIGVVTSDFALIFDTILELYRPDLHHQALHSNEFVRTSLPHKKMGRDVRLSINRWRFACNQGARTCAGSFAFFLCADGSLEALDFVTVVRWPCFHAPKLAR